MKRNRRSFIEKSLIMVAGVATGIRLPEIYGPSISTPSFPPDVDAFKVSLFSKQLQWLDFDKMADVLEKTGFDGVDLTVRPGGHVDPEKVERDLPKAAENLAKRGKKIYMITTSIDSADNPTSVKIIKTCSELGIKHYRMDWSHYDNTKSVDENITLVETRLKKLVLLIKYT